MKEFLSVYSKYSAQLGAAAGILLVVAALTLIFMIYQIIYTLIYRWISKKDVEWLPIVRKYLYGPVLVAVLVTSIMVGYGSDPFLKGAAHRVMRQTLYIALITSYAYLLIRLMQGVRLLLLRSYNLADPVGNSKAKKVVTQARVIERIVIFFVVIIAVAFILMSFSTVRRVGISMLASAGVAGIILGFSAQKTLSTIFASIQIAITQPIRIDDVVIVEGHYGRVAEIGLTYVVLALWDERELVVPINHFIEKPFENYSRSNSSLLGTVFIYTDYDVDVEGFRSAFLGFVSTLEGWDGRVANFVITNLTSTHVEMRGLISTSDLTKMFDMRTAVREFLLNYLQKHQPAALPVTRIVFADGEASRPPQLPAVKP